MALLDRPHIASILATCVNYVCILHRFRDITSCLAYVTICILEQSFQCVPAIITVAHAYPVRKLIRAMFSEVWSLQLHCIAEVTIEPLDVIDSCTIRQTTYDLLL